MKFLCELLLARDHAEFRPWKTGEVEPSIPFDLVGRLNQVIADSYIYVKADKGAPGHSGLNREPATALGRGIEVQNGLTDLENETIGQIN
jgi:hypothetical protein